MPGRPVMRRTCLVTRRLRAVPVGVTFQQHTSFIDVDSISHNLIGGMQ